MSSNIFKSEEKKESEFEEIAQIGTLFGILLSLFVYSLTAYFAYI
jgi:hypothetical protein